MMRSLFSGVSGLKNHQVRMDTIGNNIANVNTIAYKQSNVNFQDIIGQTMQSAVGANGSRGGINPVQVGLGMGISSIDTDFSNGSTMSTGRSTDLMINNAGLFVVSDGASKQYTRAGGFSMDSSKSLIVAGSGLKLMGGLADSSGNINTSGNVVALELASNSIMDEKASSFIQFKGNLDARSAIGKTVTTSQPVMIWSEMLIK